MCGGGELCFIPLLKAACSRVLPLLSVLLSRAVGLSVSQDGAEADQAGTTHPHTRRYRTRAVLRRLGESLMQT